MHAFTTLRHFNIRLVNQGDAYGLNQCLMHAESDPLVEFYDSRYPHTPLGQFVSRYYASTLLESHLDRGLLLDGGIPEWSITRDEFTLLRDLLTGETA